MKRESRISFWEALIPIAALLFTVIMDLLFLKTEDVRIALIVATVAAVAVGVVRRVPWSQMEEDMIEGIKRLGYAFIFITLIGALIASFSLSGITANLIYYGIDLISPKFMLVTSLLVSMILATALGSSWVTMGVMGPVLLGIGLAMGFNHTQLAMVAGAVVSGAYFGDKISPLSDTTVLAASASDVDMWDHVKHNLIYSGIGFGITIILFAFLGIFASGEANVADINAIKSGIDANFNINPLYVLPILLVVPMVIFKVPAVPALFGLTIAGMFIALTQGFEFTNIINGIIGEVSIVGDGSLTAQIVDRGGISGQGWTISLVLLAALMSGVYQSIGGVDAIGEGIMKFANSERRLISASAMTSTFFATLSGDQYVSLTISPEILKKEYDSMGADRINLARAAEDGGTVAGVLVPWTTCGATAVASFSIANLSTFDYAPFAIFPLVSIALGIILPLVGFKIKK